MLPSSVSHDVWAQRVGVPRLVGCDSKSLRGCVSMPKAQEPYELKRRFRNELQVISTTASLGLAASMQS